jgi:cell division protein FtsQ
VIYGANGGVPGIWLARRRRSRRRRTALLLALLGVAVGGSVAYAVGNRVLDGAWNIRHVEIAIDGPGVLTAAEVREALALPASVSWRQLDAPALEARLRAMPRVAQAHLAYAWFQRLRVTVRERAAVGMTLGRDGRVMEVGADGLLLEPRGSGAADLPLLTWDEFLMPEPPEVGEVLDLPGGPDLTALLRQLQVSQPDLWSGVSEAHLRSDGTYEIFWNEAPTVVWGRGRMAPTRLQAWATVMADLRRRGEKDVVVDLRFRDQVVVRRPAAAARPPRPLG